MATILNEVINEDFNNIKIKYEKLKKEYEELQKEYNGVKKERNKLKKRCYKLTKKNKAITFEEDERKNDDNKEKETSTSKLAIDPYGIKNVNFSIPVDDKSEKEKYKKQREERGYDDTECWNVDSTLAKFLTPRLKTFKEISHGYHTDSKKKWNNILDKMITGFELYTDHFEWDYDEKKRKENIKKVDEALMLLQKYFYDLWE